jgi:activating signal cointegrator 1
MNLPCLSLWQPWASVIFLLDERGMQLKKDETRHWETNVRGRIAIHAAKSLEGRKDFTDEELPEPLSWYDNCIMRRKQMPLGCILGTVEIIACHKTETIRARRSEEQLRWGNYADGRYAFELKNPELLAIPIPYVGRQGFFRVEL